MEDNLRKATSCEINPKKVKYLGVYIDRDLKNLLSENYDKLWRSINIDLSRWSKQQLSWSARMAAIKMNILPRLNFLFQSLPLDIKEKTLTTWQSQINKFIWNYKRHGMFQNITR